MKKIYQNPRMKLMKLSATQIICQSIKRAAGNSDMKYTGSGHGEACAPGTADWDDWEE
jgi:hypothetical protein